MYTVYKERKYISREDHHESGSNAWFHTQLALVLMLLFFFPCLGISQLVM